MITDLLGEFTVRAPGYALNSEKKIFLVNYLTLIRPIKTGGLSYAPIDRPAAKKIFEKMLKDWGIFNLSEWTLIIDARDEWFRPHISMESQLKNWSKKFKKIVIESNSIFDPAESKYAQIDFHPTTCIILNDWYTDLQQKNIDWFKIQYEKHFIALARRPSKPRVLFIKQLLDEGFGSVLRASCGSRIGAGTYYKRRPIIITNPKTNNKTSQTTPDTTIEEFNDNDGSKLFSPYKWPMYLDGEVEDSIAVSTINPIFYTNAINVICETMELDNQPINLSEKTFKAFAWHQIPLWHASPGTVQLVRDLGFDVFDDIIDHSYDSLPYEQRKDFVVQQMHNFQQTYPTTESLSKLKRNIWSRLVANNQRVEYWVEYESNIRNTLYKK